METLAKQAVAEQQSYSRETRAYHDATTWLAETLDGRMRTTFEYNFDGQELYASDGGALAPIFETAIDDASQLASKNPALGFEKRRRQIELDEYGDMLKMASGELPNTMVVVSDFPPELINASQDVGGYNASRKQTMLRIIALASSGQLTMRSQSLDGSNRAGLEAIYASFGLAPASGELLGQRIYSHRDPAEQEFLADKLTGVYDHSLENQTGRQYRAGRRLPDTPGLETYQFVRNQTDLVDYLTDKMLTGQLNDENMFSTAATMSSRYQRASIRSNLAQAESASPLPLQRALEWEIHQAASEARASGQTFSGCGASVGGETGASGELAASGFGNKTASEDCEFTSKHCPKCHKKNVKTTAKNGRYYGACGCKS